MSTQFDKWKLASSLEKTLKFSKMTKNRPWQHGKRFWKSRPGWNLKYQCEIRLNVQADSPRTIYCYLTVLCGDVSLASNLARLRMQTEDSSYSKNYLTTSSRCVQGKESCVLKTAWLEVINENKVTHTYRWPDHNQCPQLCYPNPYYFDKLQNILKIYLCIVYIHWRL